MLLENHNVSYDVQHRLGLFGSLHVIALKLLGGQRRNYSVNFMQRWKRVYHVNVKIPQTYVAAIDKGLEQGGFLCKSGFVSRAHFVREATREKLIQLGLLSEKDVEKVAKRRVHRKLPRRARK